uniref:Uncharacterized protein n=1 Tax=Oncorhynchus tshawytscha TaxID=74940 RepID=A0A8C8FWY2_ONCTS
MKVLGDNISSVNRSFRSASGVRGVMKSTSLVSPSSMLVMFSQGYPRIAGYHDVSIVTRAGPGDPRHGRDLHIEDYHQWIWTKGSQFCKSSLTGLIASLTYFELLFHPLTMALLKELREFITKEKKLRIASSTNLSERQVNNMVSKSSSTLSLMSQLLVILVNIHINVL